LHPNQYATRLLEEINFPIVPSNIRAVAAAIECEARTMSVMSAYEFVLECTRYAIAMTVRSRDFSLPMGSTAQNGGTAMDDRLVPRQADRNALSNLSLTPWENTLASEICLTRVNAKACR
jgi:hypothetical protein